MSHPEKNRSVLQERFAEFKGFLPGQEAAIDRVCAGKNTLCLMPTGAGKSLVYQVAGIRRRGTTLVVAPLVALMAQQADRLAKRPGVAAVGLSDLASMKYFEHLRSFDFENGPSFIFTSPERLAFNGFLEFMLRRKRQSIGLIVIDEAHCVSQWGHTFRPAYKALPGLLDGIFGAQAWPPVLCLTATLNPRDQEEICKDFRIDEQDVLRASTMFRKNLTLSCEHHENEDAKKARLQEILDAHPEGKILVYVHRKTGEFGTGKLAEHFKAAGLSCDYFDADRKDTDKDDVLAAFESGSLRIVFATSAFGMGIDIPDIRVVVHYLLPESIEQYYQEVGRAGRDGAPAYGYLLFTPTNVKVRRDLIQKSVLTRKEIEAVFASKLKLREGATVRTLDPFRDIAEEKGERSALFALMLEGIVNVIAKGPTNVESFAPTGRGTAGKLEGYLAASKAKTTLGIVRKLGLPAQKVVADLWQLLADGEAKLAGMPVQGMFFSTPSAIPDDLLDAIETGVQEKLAARLSGFAALANMVAAGGDPTEHVCAHLGLE